MTKFADDECAAFPTISAILRVSLPQSDDVDITYQKLCPTVLGFGHFDHYQRFDVVFMSERGGPFVTNSFSTPRLVLFTFTWIWRKIFKFIWLPLPFF